MRRFALAIVLWMAACSVELADPETQQPFTPLGGSTGTGATGTGSTTSGGTGNAGGGGGPPGGTSGTGAGGGVGGGLNDSGPGDPCLDCVHATCPQYQQCLDTPDCLNLSNCIDGCLTPNCQVDCLNIFNAAYNLYFASLSCPELSCGSTCGDTQCNSCESTNCNAVKINCVGNSECLGYWYCISVCEETNCFLQCEALWDGEDQYFDYVDCVEAYCAGVCL
jgi:hypothetical protein